MHQDIFLGYNAFVSCLRRLARVLFPPSSFSAAAAAAAVAAKDAAAVAAGATVTAISRAAAAAVAATAAAAAAATAADNASMSQLVRTLLVATAKKVKVEAMPIDALYSREVMVSWVVCMCAESMCVFSAGQHLRIISGLIYQNPMAVGDICAACW